MAPKGKVQISGAPVLSRIILNDKCLKCSKTVKNGILCDLCDRWNHFKCAEINEKDIPDESEEWKCPACVSSNMVDSKDAVDNDVSNVSKKPNS